MLKVLNVWGKKLKMKVDLDCIDGEIVTPVQKETMAKFLSDKTLIDGALPKVKKYCLKESELKDQDSIENIFEYVVPKTIFVPRDDKKMTVAVLCDYEFDKEHGIAIVYENNKLKKITEQDEVI